MVCSRACTPADQLPQCTLLIATICSDVLLAKRADRRRRKQLPPRRHLRRGRFRSRRAQGPRAPTAACRSSRASERGVIASWVEQSGQVDTTLKFSERTALGWSAPMTIVVGQQLVPQLCGSTQRAPPAGWDARRQLAGVDQSRARRHRISTSPTRKTTARRGRDRSSRITTAPRDSTHFRRSSRCQATCSGVVWVDARAQAANPEDLEASYSVRYAAFDSSWKRTAEGEIDKKTCECCSTSAAITSDGVITVFRDRSDKEIRDIAVSRFENGKWSDSAIVHDDNFETYSCPVNGPMVSARGRASVVVAWFTVKNDLGQAWAAFSNDAGRTLGARRSASMTPARSDAWTWRLLDDGSAVATWVEFADKTRPVPRAPHRTVGNEVSADQRRRRGRQQLQRLPAHGAPGRRAGVRVDRERGQGRQLVNVPGADGDGTPSQITHKQKGGPRRSALIARLTKSPDLPNVQSGNPSDLRKSSRPLRPASRPTRIRPSDAAG